MQATRIIKRKALVRTMSTSMAQVTLAILRKMRWSRTWSRRLTMMMVMMTTMVTMVTMMAMAMMATVAVMMKRTNQVCRYLIHKTDTDSI